MQTGLLHLHSFLRWAILLSFLVAIFKSLGAGDQPFTKGHKTAGLLLLICFDTNVLIGLVQWFTGGYGLQVIQNNGMATVMKDATLRFFAVEHITVMIIAAILVHVGRSFAKKNIPDRVKHRKTVLYYVIAFIIVLASIPWPFREVGQGRGWF
ncbi:MAG: hypothetical protein QM640_14425 [Niabella sp.]